MSQTEGATTAEQNPVETNGSAEASESTGGKTQAVAVAAGAGAAVAGLAGGFVVAARDTRRRVLGVPVGKRTRMQQTAGTVVDRVHEPVRRVGSRFSRG